MERTANRPATAGNSRKVNHTGLPACSSLSERRSCGKALACVCRMFGAVTLATLETHSRRFRQLCSGLAALLATAFISIVYAEDGTEYWDQITPDTGLVRIVSADFSGGLYESSKSLATLFNWRHMPDQFAGGETINRAIAVSTAGPLSSLEALMEGRAELAIVRADLADRIFKRDDEIRFDARGELRLLSTHIPVMLHVVVRDDFEGNNLSDLAGKRVNIGTEDAATMLNLSELLHQSGFATSTFEPYFAPVRDALRRLDTGSVDAVAFFDQAPSTLVSDSLNTRKFRLLAVNSEQDIGDTKGKFTPPSAQSHYFSTANTADFYNNGQNSPALVAATYLLSRREVSQESLNSVISLLDIRPIGTKPGEKPAAAKADDADNSLTVEPKAEFQLKVDPAYYQQPFRVADWMSPIPLHPSAQVQIDIFTDPLVIDGLDIGYPELDPALILQTGQSSSVVDPQADAP